MLDCFTNQGGFALACAKAGAANVTAVDVSASACEAARKNAALNNVEIEVLEHNVFDFLKHAKPDYDLIILDPPSFTRNKATLMDAMRGYKEIHLRSLKLLDKGGLLSTFCCSYHASRELFMDNLVDASVDAKKSAQAGDEPRPARGSPDPDFDPGNRVSQGVHRRGHRIEISEPHQSNPGNPESLGGPAKLSARNFRHTSRLASDRDSVIRPTHGWQISSGRGPTTSEPPESNSAEIPNPSSPALGVRQAMHASKRSSTRWDNMNSRIRASQSISFSKNPLTASLDSSDNSSVTRSRHTWQIAYSITHSPRRNSLFTSHGPAISTSGSLQHKQCENASPVSSDPNHSSIVRMSEPKQPGGGLKSQKQPVSNTRTTKSPDRRVAGCVAAARGYYAATDPWQNSISTLPA